MHLSFDDVTFTYEGAVDTVFQNLNFTLGIGWTGVVGANGAGKTTLLRLALEEIHPTSGHVMAPREGIHCQQRTDSPPEGLEDLLRAPDSQTRKLIRQLGLMEDWADRWDSLSHGERKRAQVAVALHHTPSFLAIDEPTNHLDRESRALVRQALCEFRGIGLLVSHDRELLDTLCNQCLFLDPPLCVLRPGGYSAGSLQMARERTHAQRLYEKTAREVAQLRAELNQRRDLTAKGEQQRSKRGIVKGDHDAKARINAARVSDSGSGQRMRQMEGRVNQAEARQNALRVQRRFALGIILAGERSPRNQVIAMPEQELPLGDKRTLWIPALVIRVGDRIGITGPNGAGKSTLIRRMAEDLKQSPDRVFLIPQEIDVLQSQGILREFKRLSDQHLGRAMSLVRRLGSDPSRILQTQQPSPGELRKLLLAGSIEAQPHLVMLDEPTNHLDLPSVECLEEALEGCAATLVMVSHDERFLGRLTNRRWDLRPVPGGFELRE